MTPSRPGWPKLCLQAALTDVYYPGRDFIQQYFFLPLIMHNMTFPCSSGVWRSSNVINCVCIDLSKGHKGTVKTLTPICRLERQLITPCCNATHRQVNSGLSCFWAKNPTTHIHTHEPLMLWAHTISSASVSNNDVWKVYLAVKVVQLHGKLFCTRT